MVPWCKNKHEILFSSHYKVKMIWGNALMTFFKFREFLAEGSRYPFLLTLILFVLKKIIERVGLSTNYIYYTVFLISAMDYYANKEKLPP